MEDGGHKVDRFEGVKIEPVRGRPRIHRDARAVLLDKAEMFYRYGLTRKQLARHFEGQLDDSAITRVVQAGKRLT